VLYNNAIIAVAPKDHRSISAMVSNYGVWQEYRALEGTSITPVLAPDVLALVVEGDEVREVAAFHSPSLTLNWRNPPGTWARQALRRPAKGPVQPVVGPGWAYYRVGGDVYAYSGMMNGWDALYLDGPERPKVATSTTAILVEHAETLYVFNLGSGKWSKGLKVPSPAAK
jgi:hypothetical protein